MMCGISRRQLQLLAPLLLLLITALGCGATSSALDHETMLCSNDNAPMCARSRSEYLLFKNECDLRKAQRENLLGAPLFDVALQHCVPTCDFECDTSLQPICGVSVATGVRKSFRNRCEMARTSCQSKSDWLVYKWGVCPIKGSKPKQAAHTLLVGQRKRRRPLPCTNVYRPVCASYAGVKSTFSNECLVNAENIRTRRNWRVVSEGLCGEDSIKMKHSRKYKPKSKPKVEVERSKRSHKQLNQLEDFEISEDTVQIFAPSTFHTQFISNAGTMEKSYSLPARKPYIAEKPKHRSVYGTSNKSRAAPGKKAQARTTCVFSNEPVCGSFNGETRTFDNVCALMEYSQAVGNAWTILHDGTCRRCDKPCPTVYSPICANRNGIGYTIINECYLDRVRCKDPNSNWKITHKGECSMLNEEVSQSIPFPRQKPSSLIPSVLYSPKIATETTTTPKTLSNAKTTMRTHRQLRKRKRPTTMPLTTSAPSPSPSTKDLSNRKIRKIESEQFVAIPANHQSMELATSKLWGVKDNWLLGHYAGNENHMHHAHQKRINPKKAFGEKYPQLSWSVTPATPTQLIATTVTAKSTITSPTLATSSPSTEKIDARAETSTESQPVTEPSTTPKTTTRTISTMESTSTTIAPTTTTATISTTEASQSWRTTQTTALPEPSSSKVNNILEDDTTEEVDLSTSSSTSTESEADTVDIETTATAPASSPTTTTTTTMLTSPVSSPTTGIFNMDYMADGPLLDEGEQTSIYGLDKNSLIMRLLRARSSKNMVL